MLHSDGWFSCKIIWERPDQHREFWGESAHEALAKAIEEVGRLEAKERDAV